MRDKITSKKNLLLAASVAGLLATSGIAALTGTAYAKDVECSGVNACKGIGDCGGKGNSCAGKNACKGQGWLKFPSEERCKKVGGTAPNPQDGNQG